MLINEFPYYILSCLDIFVLPSKNEGISNTIMEAMACGLPVVATDVGGNPELVIEGETGLLVPPGNPEAMAEALEKYILNRGLLKEHGMNGRKRIEHTFSLGKMADDYLHVYQQLISQELDCASLG